MSEKEGNAIFLICGACLAAGEADYGVRLAQRDRISGYEPAVPEKQFNAWLGKHFKCGGRDDKNRPDVDHFKLGYLLERNHDQVVRKAIAAAIAKELN